VHGSVNVADAKCRNQTHKDQIDNMIREGEGFRAIDLKVEKALAARFKYLSAGVLLVTFLFLGLAVLSCMSASKNDETMWTLEPYADTKMFFNNMLSLYGALLLGGWTIGVPMVLNVFSFVILNVFHVYWIDDREYHIIHRCIGHNSTNLVAAWPLITLICGALWHLSVNASRAVREAAVGIPLASVELNPLRTKAWRSYQMLLRAVALAVALYIKVDWQDYCVDGRECSSINNGTLANESLYTEANFWNWPPIGRQSVPMFGGFQCHNPWGHQQDLFFQRPTVVPTQFDGTLFA